MNRNLRQLDDLAAFGISAERGFLPSHDPLARLPDRFERWEQIAAALPKLLVADQHRVALDELPLLEIHGLSSAAEVERAMMLLSYFGHAYVWGAGEPQRRVPASVAVPWFEVSHRLGRPPVLSYASYALHNWRRLDARRPIQLGNIVLLQNFLGGVDEEWFVLVHVEIEAHAAEAIAAIPEALAAVSEDDVAGLERALQRIAASLRRMNATLARMPERCDPHIYFHRVRPYIFGWKDHPALPDGLVYEGVVAYGGRPQRFRGETGAQSSIVPALDAALGISHEHDPLRDYLREMRVYMPPGHRAFIAAVEEGLSVREYVLLRRATHPSSRDVYNACVEELQKFRATHLDYARAYIHEQSQRQAANPSKVGTGGTPFMAYLKKHLEETAAHVIR